MDNEVDFNYENDNNSIINYLLLIKNNYEKLLYKNNEFADNLSYVNKKNPYNIEIPLDIKLLLNSKNTTDIYVKMQHINVILKNQIEKTNELLNKYCNHSYVEDTIETKNEVLIDVEYCAKCYLNKE
jgi:hypothetical protein